jgi:uncharacterized RDD family membrane protein YckC
MFDRALVAAWIVDVVLEGIIFFGAFSAVWEVSRYSISAWDAFWLQVGVGYLYQLFFLTRNNGQTPGKALMGVQVVKLNYRDLSAMDVLVRYLGSWITTGSLLGLIIPFTNDKRQGAHDMLANTMVVRK